jgi:hypothetical protein
MCLSSTMQRSLPEIEVEAALPIFVMCFTGVIQAYKIQIRRRSTFANTSGDLA